MLKTFLVEDEVVIREMIKKMISWEQYGFELAGEASDGEMALPLILKSKFVFPFLRSEKPLYSIRFSICLKFHAAVISTALPWLIPAPFIFIQQPVEGQW